MFPTFKSQVFKALCVKFTAFTWQPLLFCYLHLPVLYCICRFRLAVPDLQFHCHPLGKQSLLPVPTIIIRSLENEFDSCFFSLLNYLDQKIWPMFFFHIYFNIAPQLTLYNQQFTTHQHLWRRLLQMIRKLHGLMDEALAWQVTEKLGYESIRS